MRTAIEILTEARALIEKPGTWTQLSEARDSRGNKVSIYDEDVASFCAVGALRRAAHGSPEYAHARHALQAASQEVVVGGRRCAGTISMNDGQGTEQKDVLEAYDRAITMLSGEP